MLPTLLIFTGCITIDPPENPLAIDDDGDGYTEFEGDCDDRDPNTFPGSVTEATSDECMRDSDGDGFGDVEVAGEFDAGTDCDDNDASTFPSSVTEATSGECMKDADGDGFGDSDVEGEFDAGTDCDDSNPFAFPGAAENESDSECLTDTDEDGWSAENTDCDDESAALLDIANDADCDGVLTIEDCNDGDNTQPHLDQDCDGVLTVDDCDDGDAVKPNEDSDCDGVLTVDDCDDSDSLTVNDMDCDGVLSVDDCNDSDSTQPNMDQDCDGTLTGNDCDDLDGLSTIIVEDMDCDGVLTTDDCNDNDNTQPNLDQDCDGVLSIDDCDDTDLDTVNDMDCDGVLTVDDCDDSDPNTVNDMDCDGVLSMNDCDDFDSSSTVVAIDGDCDGVLTVDDCDDGDAVKPNEDSDCDGVLTVDDCDDNDPNTTNDMDCDGVLSIDDCDDFDSTLLEFSNDMDCDGVLTVDDCDDSDPLTVNDMDCDGVLSMNDCDDLDPIVVNVCLELGGGELINMVLISAGDDPFERYTLTNDFYLMTTEVTQGMFTALMSYDPTTYSTTYGVGNDFPAYYVNWHMAADFANKVTQRHNSVNGITLQECYSCSDSGSTSVSCTEAVNPYQCSGYVLPTEGEWEYAARSGSQYDFWTPNGGGNYSANACNGTETIQDGVSTPQLSDYSWYCGNLNNQYGGNGSKEVAQKLPNGFGLYDMHGNLWEWTSDKYGCSFPQTDVDPYCGSAGSDRVKRGGYWYNYPYAIGVSHRDDMPASIRDYHVGFRIGRHP